MTRKVLTEAMIAAMQSGVSINATAADVPATVAVPAAAAAAVAAPAAAAAAADGIGGAAPAAAAAATEGTGGAAPAKTPEQVAAETAAAAIAAAATTPSAVDAGVLTYLQGQLTTKDAALLAANVENTGLKARLAEMEATMPGLVKIAAKSVNSMRIALGGSAQDLSALTPVQLLAQHDTATADFQKVFVAGGVAAVDAAQASKPAVTQMDSLQKARLRAVNGGK